MRKAPLTLLAAATLLFTGAQAQASVTLRVASSMDSDDLRIASTVEQITLRSGGDVRLGAGLDPNRVQIAQAGVVMIVNFAGISFGSQFNEPGSTPGGSVSGAFFGPGRAPSGVADVTLSSGSLSSGSSPRYAEPFLVSRTVGALTPVPEPSNWALMLAGATGLAGFVRVRARHRA